MNRLPTIVKMLRAARRAGLLAGALAFGGTSATIAPITIITTITLITPGARAQCAMCKEAAYDQHDTGLSQRLGRGFNASVYSMLGVPIVLLAGLVVLIRKNLRAQSRNDPRGPDRPSDAP